LSTEKPSGQYLSLICDESLTCRGLNSNPGHSRGSTYYPCSCGESCLLVSWCAGSRCDMAGSDEDLGRSRRPGAEDRDGRAQVGYSVVERSGGRVTLCAVCTMHMETRSAGFLVEPQNRGVTSSTGFLVEPQNQGVTSRSSPCAWYRPHTTSPDLPIIQPPSTQPVLDHPRSSAPGLLLLPRSLSPPAMSHLLPAHHETSKRDSPHEQG
jgi:hypothetical protein